MKIAHIGLASYFTEGMTYQDNYLSHINALDGNEVLFVSNAAKYENGAVVSTGYEDLRLPDGVRLVRLPYVHVLGRFVTEKFRKVRGLYALLEEFAPDVILCHGLAFYSVLDVLRYKRNHPGVKLYADTHADYYTSGTNWLSLHVLHRMFYRSLVRRALPYLEKYFYTTSETCRFSAEVYGVPREVMEFYPLGGVLPTEEAYHSGRTARRAELGVQPNELLLVHAGKLEPQKKTDSLLRAFAAVPELKARLAVIGSIPEEDKEALTAEMAADPRVTYLGWKSGDDLQEYLCAADLYCQPGKVSAIMQNAVCCRCPVMIYPHPDYVGGYDYGNILWEKDENDMIRIFRKLAAGEIGLEDLRRNAERCAKELLDYRALAARLYR